MRAYLQDADNPLYVPPKPKRFRSTKSQVEEFRADLYDIVQAQEPMTVRQVFYQATVKGIVDKLESGYRKVLTDLIWMRKNDELPYGWLVDNTRWQRKPRTFSSVEEALNNTAQLYRKDLWYNADKYVEIWMEKDALTGVVVPITAQFDVPLMVARGYSSISFLESTAESIRELDVPCYLYHFGDFDPSGVNAGTVIERTLRQRAPGCEIHFERVAVTPEQITQWDLPTRPTKEDDPRAKKFGSDISVELDAIPPADLRKLVQDVIERHLPQHQYQVLRKIEAEERATIRQMVESMKKSGGKKRR